MTLPVARWGPAACACSATSWALVLRPGRVRRLCGRKDPELNALDHLQLLGPTVILLALAGRRPDELSVGVRQPVSVVVPRLVTWGYAVRPFFFMGGDPAHKNPPNVVGLQRVPIPGPRCAWRSG